MEPESIIIFFKNFVPDGTKMFLFLCSLECVFLVVMVFICFL